MVMPTAAQRGKTNRWSKTVFTTVDSRYNEPKSKARDTRLCLEDLSRHAENQAGWRERVVGFSVLSHAGPDKAAAAHFWCICLMMHQQIENRSCTIPHNANVACEHGLIIRPLPPDSFLHAWHVSRCQHLSGTAALPLLKSSSQILILSSVSCLIVCMPGSGFEKFHVTMNTKSIANRSRCWCHHHLGPGLLPTGNWRSSASKLFLVSTPVWHSCFPGPKPLDQKVCNWLNLLCPFPCIMTGLHVNIGCSSVLSYSSFYFQPLNNSCGWNLLAPLLHIRSNVLFLPVLKPSS